MLRGLHAEWHRFAPGLAGPEDLDERGMRLWWANQELAKFYKARGGRFVRINGRNVFMSIDAHPILSWKDLRPYEAKHLLQVLREETGEAAAYRIGLMHWLTMELAGDPWYPNLRADARFGSNDLRKLSPRQHKALIEELFSQLARKEIAQAGDEVNGYAVKRKMNELRKRFSKAEIGK